MALLSTIVSRMPAMYQARYSSHWIDWMNELLEELSEFGIMRDVDKEQGRLVVNKYWIKLPTGTKQVKRVFYPGYEDRNYRWKIVEGKIKLLDDSVDAETSPETITTFSNFATTTVDVDISDASEDQFKNYLLVLTSGTGAGNTYVIASNTESSGGTCTLTFMHELSVALDGTIAAGGYLTGPSYYLMVEYTSGYTAVSALSDEVPIDDYYERRISYSWLDYCMKRHAFGIDDSSTIAAYGQYERVVRKIKIGLRSSVGVVEANPSPGFMQYRRKSTQYNKGYAEEI